MTTSDKYEANDNNNHVTTLPLQEIIVTLQEWWNNGTEQNLLSNNMQLKTNYNNETTNTTAVDKKNHNTCNKQTANYGTTNKPHNSSLPAVFDEPTTQKENMVLPLIDLRSEEAFAQRHISVATVTTSNVKTEVVNLPFETLLSGERCCELPPRHVDFAILIPSIQSVVFDLQKKKNANDHDRNSICEDDERKENGKPRLTTTTAKNITHGQVANFFFATTSKATFQSRKPWKVKQVLQDCEETWIDAHKLCLLSTSNDATNSNNIVPLSRLWKPDPMVETILLPLLKRRIDDQLKATTDIVANNKVTIEINSSPMMSLPQTASSSYVWDLGSGAGRDVCFLAEELKFHILSSKVMQQKQESSSSSHAEIIRFVGIDNHKGSARRCLPLWKRRHVGHMTEARLVDLNNIELFHDYIVNEQQSYSNIKSEEQKTLSTNNYSSVVSKNYGSILCIYAIRFLNRKLINYIIGDTCPLMKGTLFAMSHFSKRHEDSSWDFDHPKELHVLNRYELTQTFDNSGKWKVLHDEICEDGDHGRTLVQFVAERL